MILVSIWSTFYGIVKDPMKRNHYLLQSMDTNMSIKRMID